MSKVQFNLLPPSKMKVVSARTEANAVTKKVMLATAICAALFILLLIYTAFIQRAVISSTKNSITAKTAELQKTPNLNTILTVENQLQTAASLHEQQHDTSRIFKYLVKLTPVRASVSNLDLQTTDNSLKISGTADSAGTVNAFIDSLKYAQYKIGNSAPVNAFSSVVEDGFSISGKTVNYSLSASFDPQLFANNLADSAGHLITPTLIVPASTTTRTNNPGSLFGGGR